MKRLLKIASFVLAGATIGAWAALGMNTGWSKDRVMTTQTDEVTGIEQVAWVEKWVPGVDFLAVGLAVSGVLLIPSLPRKPKKI